MPRQKRIMKIFTGATLAPVVLLLAGSLWGDLWIIAALFYMTLFTYGLDMIVKFASPPEHPDSEFPAADLLSLLLGLAHLALLPTVIFSLTHRGFELWEQICLFWAAGLFFGQVSNSNAHELIHRSNRSLRQLGRAVYISLLFGHHASAHPKVHHVYVATEKDPNSASLGQSFYNFAPRAWAGSLLEGFKAESQFQKRRSQKATHPYIIYAAGSVLCLTLAAFIGGLSSVYIYVALSLYATLQLLLSDYVQHYGLRRQKLPSGKYEPVSDAHSWNAPHWFSSYMMLNAPRHSDHHANPMTPYPELSLATHMPMLPRPLPAMATLALIPPLWRRVMDCRVARVNKALTQSSNTPSSKTA